MKNDVPMQKRIYEMYVINFANTNFVFSLEYYIEGVVRLVYIATILCTFLILSSVTSRSGADCMSKR